MSDKIDFVIPWVDGNDIEWQKERNKYAGKDPEDLADYRYRDWDNLKYWFRGIEKYAPWVNKVFFVTNGQKPDWLNLDCEKLVWVKHEDYIPKEYLPTFNSHTIEHNLFRIKDLSENFVYFNDDVFLIDNCFPEDFFKNGLPCMTAGLEPFPYEDEIYAHILINNIILISKHFDFKDCFNKNKKKWINKKYYWKNNIKTIFLSKYGYCPGIIVPHIENSLKKSEMKKIWDQDYDVLNQTCLEKFRDKSQVSQFIYSWSIMASGDFEPRTYKFGKYFTPDEFEKVKEALLNKKYKSICINDVKSNIDFEEAKKTINSAFEQLLPEKSSFER